MTKLKELLNKTGTTQAKLADKLGVKQNTVSSWVTGRTKTPQYVLDMLETVIAPQIPFVPCIPAPPPYGVEVPISYEFSCHWQPDPATGYWWNIRTGAMAPNREEAFKLFTMNG